MNLARWITRFRNLTPELKDILIKTCKKIMVTDLEFGYNVSGTEHEYVDILSGDKKQAFRRGMWMRENVDEKLYFKVFKELE